MKRALREGPRTQAGAARRLGALERPKARPYLPAWPDGRAPAQRVGPWTASSAVAEVPILRIL